MPHTRPSPPPPSSDALTHFLSARQPRPVAEIAALLGWPHARVKAQAIVEAGLLGGGLVQWGVAARWLFDTHGLRPIFEILGSETPLLPCGLQLLMVNWRLPAYIVHALKMQAQLESMPHRVAPPPEFTDYLWDVLHRAIDADTVARLHGDRDFIAAYEFPDGDTEG